MTRTAKRWLYFTLLLPLAVIAAVAASLAYYAYSPLGPVPAPREFSLRQGSSLKSSAQQMADAGVVGNPTLFVIFARLMGQAGKIKAGNYEIIGPLSPMALLRKITEGDYTQDVLTVVEGWTFQ